MGCCSQESSSTTTIPEPTPEELALLDLSNSMMQAYMEASGFEVTRTETGWDESEQGQSFTRRRQQLQSQIDDIDSRINDASRGGGGAKGAANTREGYGAINQFNVQKNGLYDQMRELEAEEQSARANFKPDVNYTTREKADFATEQIRKQYGADSQEYKDAYAGYVQRRGREEADNNSIKQSLLDKTKKLLSGDYGLNEGEQRFMGELLGPMREAGLNAINYIETAQTTDQGIGKALENFGNQIKQTGMDMGDAVLALENRVRQTGADMQTALDEEVETTKQLVRMGIEDFTSAQRREIASKAALLGRSATDPEFQRELQETATREIQRSNLEAGRYAAEKRVAIAERTGQGLENAANMRVGIAERTGQGLEGVAQARVGYADEAARMRGSLETNLAGQEASIRSNLAYGLQPQFVGMGMDVAGFNNAINQQRLNNIQSGYSMPLNTYNTMARERFAQPTTTTTTTPSIASQVTGLIGAGMSGVGAAGSLGWRPFG